MSIQAKPQNPTPPEVLDRLRDLTARLSERADISAELAQSIAWGLIRDGWIAFPPIVTAEPGPVYRDYSKDERLNWLPCGPVVTS